MSSFLLVMSQHKPCAPSLNHRSFLQGKVSPMQTHIGLFLTSDPKELQNLFHLYRWGPQSHTRSAAVPGTDLTSSKALVWSCFSSTAAFFTCFPPTLTLPLDFEEQQSHPDFVEALLSLNTRGLSFLCFTCFCCCNNNRKQDQSLFFFFSQFCLFFKKHARFCIPSSSNKQTFTGVVKTACFQNSFCHGCSPTAALKAVWMPLPSPLVQQCANSLPGWATHFTSLLGFTPT